MTHRITAAAALVAGVLGLAAGAAAQPSKADLAKSKKALQDLQEFIGQWNMEGIQKEGGKTTAWKSKVTWGWKFKGEESWIVVEFDKDKFFDKGEVKYDPAKKKYAVKLTGTDKKDQAFVGDLVRGDFKLEGKEAGTGDVTRVAINTAASGARLIVKVQKQPGGKGLFSDAYTMGGTKEGESFAAGAKKPECIVTGGAATTAVSYMGKTYYVCCSGCRDAFNENPEKIIKDAEKKK